MKHVNARLDRLDASVCNNTQCWNKDKCRCECDELIDRQKIEKKVERYVCDQGFIWNPSNCECESCDIGENLDYENCKCRKKLVDKLVSKCTESTDGDKIARIPLAEYENECRSSFTL